MKNKVYYNKEEVILTGRTNKFLFEVKFQTGETRFIHVDDLDFISDIRDKNHFF